jgi:AcrR family transcriptional regulator
LGSVDDGEERPDGRTARRDRNREAVLDAVIELFRDDAMFPAPADVAARSGVSTRSVQRYFDDMEELVRAAMGRHVELVGHLFEVPDLGIGPQAERIERIVAARLRLFGTLAPMMRAALLRMRSNELIRQRVTEARRQVRDQVEAMFAPELDALPAGPRREVLDALDVVLEFESMEHLRSTTGRTDEEAAAVLCRAVTAVLAAAG